MSWETKNHSDKCPCGKGTITWISKMGDWNGQYESTNPVMNCKKCSKEWEYKKVGIYSDTRELRMAWVNIKIRK